MAQQPYKLLQKKKPTRGRLGRGGRVRFFSSPLHSTVLMPPAVGSVSLKPSQASQDSSITASIQRRVPVWAGARSCLERTPIRIVGDHPKSATLAVVRPSLCSTFGLRLDQASNSLQSAITSVSRVLPYTQDSLRRDAASLVDDLYREAKETQSQGKELRLLCVGLIPELLVQLGFRSELMFSPATLKPAVDLIQLGISFEPADAGGPHAYPSFPVRAVPVPLSQGGGVRRVQATLSRDSHVQTLSRTLSR